MTISSVHYARLFNLGNYENERIEATAPVIEPMSAADTLTMLQAWVAEQGGKGERLRDEISDLLARRDRLQNQIASLNQDYDQAKAAWEKATAFLQKTGLALPDSLKDDIPF